MKFISRLYTSKKRYFFVTGGRGSGKSFAVHDYILKINLRKRSRYSIH